MKKSILNLGKALNRAEQRSVNGGAGTECVSECGSAGGCATGETCTEFDQSISCPDDPRVWMCMSGGGIQ